MEWDERLETGDAKVDEQHRTLVALFTELEDAEGDGASQVPAVLERLTEYTAVHFAMEEDLMRRAGLPAEQLDRHVAEHRRLTQSVRSKVLGYRTGELTSVLPLVSFLRGWLAHHVHEVDRSLVAYCRECGERG